MKRMLGQNMSSQAIWQQDGAKPHQANMVMEWLDGIFEDRMLAIRSRRGDTWAPSSPDLNPLDYKPLPTSLEELNSRIKREVRDVPESTVMKAVYSMKKRIGRLLVEEGKSFRSRESHKFG